MGMGIFDYGGGRDGFEIVAEEVVVFAGLGKLIHVEKWLLG